MKIFWNKNGTFETNSESQFIAVCDVNFAVYNEQHYHIKINMSVSRFSGTNSDDEQEQKINCIKVLIQ